MEKIISLNQEKYMPTFKEIYSKLVDSLINKTSITLQPYESILLFEKLDSLTSIKDYESYLNYKESISQNFLNQNSFKEKQKQFNKWCKLQENYIKSVIDFNLTSGKKVTDEDKILMLKKGVDRAAFYLNSSIFDSVILSFEKEQKYITQKIYKDKKDDSPKLGEISNFSCIGEISLELSKYTIGDNYYRETQDLEKTIIDLYDSMTFLSQNNKKTTLENLYTSIIVLNKQIEEKFLVYNTFNFIIVAANIANTEIFKEQIEKYKSIVGELKIIVTDQLEDKVLVFFSNPDALKSPLIVFVNSPLTKNNKTQYDYAIIAPQMVYAFDILPESGKIC